MLKHLVTINASKSEQKGQREVSPNSLINETLESLLNVIARQVGASAGSILLYNEKDSQLCFQVSIGDKKELIKQFTLKIGEGIAGQVAESGETIICNQVSLDPLWKRDIAQKIDYETKNLIAVPLVYRRSLVGVIELLNKENGDFCANDQMEIESVASEIAAIIYNTRSLETAYVKSIRSHYIIQTSRLLNSSLDINTVLNYAIDMSMEIMEAEGSSLLLIDPKTNELVFEISKGGSGTGNKLQEQKFRLKMGEGIAGKVALSGREMLVNDTDKNSGFTKRVDKSFGFVTKSILCVPLKVKDRVIGVIELINKSGIEYFKEEDVEYLKVLANQIAIAIDNAQVYSALRQAHHEIEEWNQTLQVKVDARTKELKKAYENLKKLDEMKTDFLHVVAHDIRNPLTAILTFSQVLLFKKDNLTEGQIDGAMTICEEVKRLNQLIDDLLSFAKMQSTNFSISPVPFDFKPAIVHLLSVFINDSERRQVNLIQDIPFDTIAVNGEESKLCQVLSNLMSNALKFTPEGGSITISVQNVTVKSKPYWQFSIADTGAGIPKSDLKIIFGKFKQSSSKETKKVKGTGLGLYICKEFIAHHKGKIWVESEYGKGSTFLFTLPVL